ncbi:uncharacterized protein LOC142326502 [Lycorma delicatula]|uniref:uncharacterized protein LOC142326502 n=1 Tax=Lycorma delicatula TaxID=130591 RepID=UPI003F516598
MKLEIGTLLTETVDRYGSIKYNILIELSYEKPMIDEYRDICFKTKNFAVINVNDIEHSIEAAFESLLREETNFEGKQSGWTLLSIDGVLVRINRYRPLKGSSFIPLPKSILHKHAVVNVKNNDDLCFVWSILCKYVQGRHRNRIDKRYDALLNKYNFGSLNFPTPLSDVYKFEKMNDGVSVNVYSVDKNENIIPIKVCSAENHDHFDLLLLVEGDRRHFCFISDFERLIGSQLTKHEHGIKICKRCFTYYKTDKDCARKMADHLERCSSNPPARVVLPEVQEDGSQPVLQFKNYHHVFPVPIILGYRVTKLMQCYCILI